MLLFNTLVTVHGSYFEIVVVSKQKLVQLVLFVHAIGNNMDSRWYNSRQETRFRDEQQNVVEEVGRMFIRELINAYETFVISQFLSAPMFYLFIYFSGAFFSFCSKLISVHKLCWYLKIPSSWFGMKPLQGRINMSMFT